VSFPSFFFIGLWGKQREIEGEKTRWSNWLLVFSFSTTFTCCFLLCSIWVEEEKKRI